MQRTTQKHRTATSIPSVIAQLFALEGEGGQHWVTKQLGPGAYWQSWPGPSSGGASGGEGRGPMRGE